MDYYYSLRNGIFIFTRQPIVFDEKGMSRFINIKHNIPNNFVNAEGRVLTPDRSWRDMHNILFHKDDVIATFERR